jgi:hypothetical protein
MLDRWLVTVTPIPYTNSNEGQVDLSEVPPGEEKTTKTYIANNYFSVGTYFYSCSALKLIFFLLRFFQGIDAKVALDFHLARESHPDLFTSRGVNKLQYFYPSAYWKVITDLAWL